MELEGYEPIRKTISISKSDESKPIYETLKKLPLGNLELTLSQNATVYIDDKRVREAVADVPFTLSLRAGVYTLRFENKAYNINNMKKFSIQKDVIKRERIFLEIPSRARSTSSGK